MKVEENGIKMEGGWEKGREGGREGGKEGGMERDEMEE